MKALILEDMPESQEMLCEIAAAAFPGIECVCVADVKGALAHATDCFQLGLIDLSLPDGSGIEVIQRLATECPSCTIVVATIFDDDEHLFPALRAGAHGYLLKDEAPEVLARQLQGIREGRPPLSPSVARRMLSHFREENEAAQTEQQVSLSPREREVLGSLARGISIADIGEVMGISRHTVGDHVKNIYRKLNISSRAEAALSAKNLGLI
jgi:DNA-binding NarL/FixJ family response regulator